MNNAPMKLYVLDCGTILVRDVSNFSPGVDEGKNKLLTNSCYLIQHKGTNFLWDTGLSVANPLSKQLQELNIKPEDIDYLGISHFHFDHTGNMNLFSGSKILIQQEELDAAYSDKAESYNFSPASYSKIEKHQYITLNGDHDVFGDGRVVIKRAVGHTPGHQSLFVDLPETGPIMISGDQTHFRKNWKHDRIPAFNFDKEQSAKAIADIKAFIKVKKAQFWIKHDKEQNATIKHSPAFYQ
jgi:N-acyl homoserine lactone hydrolase